MPWRTTDMLSQRSQFIVESKSGDFSHSELCRKYGISRTAGYKWRDRFEIEGIRGLGDRSRKPKTTNKKVSYELTTQIVSYRQAHRSWGASKIRTILMREFSDVPSRRTIHRVLQECNLVSTRRRHYRRKPQERVVVKARYNNHIWTVDFKGWWRTKDGKKVFPLTIRDEYSKFVLAIEVLPSPCLDLAKEAFISCFERFGLPEYIRSDNGTPFSFSNGLCGLSRLSAWWIKLGVVPNFIPPASPQFNAGHERMHRDMAADLETSPARNITQQQIVTDQWREDFNKLRPHSALQDKTPAQVYKRSKIKYRLSEPALEYPVHMLQRFVNKQGAFRFNGNRIFISKAIGGENVGLEFTDPGSVDIWFSTSRLAHWDTNSNKITEYNLITGTFSDIKIAA
jgi:putative transposase